MMVQQTMTIRVDFLTRPSLSEVGSRNQKLEWPPHPRRLFEALTAAHYEAKVGRRETLQWLERQDPPEISASEVDLRDVGTSYVPVNDRIRSQKKSERLRQPRNFLTAHPRDNSVYFTWHTNSPPPNDLDDILLEVTRLGHSTSLVTASLWSPKPPPPTWVPAPRRNSSDSQARWRFESNGQQSLRISNDGTLDVLDQAHDLRRLKASQRDRRRLTLPPPVWHTYHRVRTATPPRGPWRQHWVWSLDPRLHLSVWLHLAEAVRGTILSVLPPDAPDVLTGHGRGDFLAIAPLAHVGHRHASGDVLGFAVLAPEIDEPTRRLLLSALGEVDALQAGPLGRFRASRVDANEYRQTLDFETWTRPSKTWATTSPMVFDRFPKGNLPPEAIVAGSLERLRLPPAAEIEVRRDGVHRGTPRSRDFTVHRRSRRRDQRPWSHVFLRWDQPVAGPILLGARRHFGLGFCRPWSPPASVEVPS